MTSRLTGNQFWRLRTKHGKDKLFGDPSVLRDEACLYFDWCDRHPWLKSELVKYRGMADEAEVPLGRPYSMDGFTCYLGVSGSYFRSAKGNIKEKIERGTATAVELYLLDTIEWVEQVVRTQQIEGAAVGVFNAGLVARINGIADNTNVNTSTPVLRVTVEGQGAAQALGDLDSLL